MSSFCWCIVEVAESSKDIFLLECEKIQENNFCLIFDKEVNRFFEEPLAKNQVFCNIAFGYDNIPVLPPKGVLNNDEAYFGYVFSHPKRIDNNAFDIARKELKERLKVFQDLIFNLYNAIGVRSFKLFYTDTSNELSLTEYIRMDWKIEELSLKMYELIENNKGLLEALTLEWIKDIKQ